MWPINDTWSYLVSFSGTLGNFEHFVLRRGFIPVALQPDAMSAHTDIQWQAVRRDVRKCFCHPVMDRGIQLRRKRHSSFCKLPKSELQIAFDHPASRKWSELSKHGPFALNFPSTATQGWGFPDCCLTLQVRTQCMCRWVQDPSNTANRKEMGYSWWTRTILGSGFNYMMLLVLFIMV